MEPNRYEPQSKYEGNNKYDGSNNKYEGTNRGEGTNKLNKYEGTKYSQEEKKKIPHEEPIKTKSTQEQKQSKIPFDEIPIKKQRDPSPDRSNVQEFDELPIKNK